ncbi:hypothetical protein HDU89_006918 [Geranomyces variabilis]|nr:hypothetical protein HDU89_006918 [Geranomyces variabilis]
MKGYDRDAQPRIKQEPSVAEASDNNTLGANHSVQHNARALRQPVSDDADLRDLAEQLGGDFVLGAADQHDVERTVMAEADEAMRQTDNAADTKRLTKTRKKITDLQAKWEDLEAQTAVARVSATTLLRRRMTKLEDQIDELREQEEEILGRMRERDSGVPVNHGEHQGDALSASASRPTTTLGGRETHREMLIRTGQITPFARVSSAAASSSALEKGGSSGGASVGGVAVKREPLEQPPRGPLKKKRAPPTELIARPRKRPRKASGDEGDDGDDNDADADYTDDGPGAGGGRDDRMSDADTGGSVSSVSYDSDSEAEDRAKRRRRYRDQHADDGNEVLYQKRLGRWAQRRRARNGDADESMDVDDEVEGYTPSDDDVEYEGGYVMPGDIYKALFDYQRTCTKWLWELHTQETGGIIGDEMGLGKTIQVISYLAGLSASRKLNGPVLIVCPATVLRQWVQEFHKWWPPFRVAILHSTGSGMESGGTMDKDDEDAMEEMMVDVDDEEEEEEVASNDDDFEGQRGRRPPKKARKAKKKPTAKKKASPHAAKMLNKAGAIVDRIVQKGHVILTTFAGMRVYSKKLLPVRWAYAILDEGHKIRNPDAAITLTCKQLRTAHRIVLTGTPIQNNLTELWSLYDFVFPGRLGTLPVFQQQFSVPIQIGGYANASNVQVQTAYKCAVVLRDLISPYLLRRMKKDVAADLPTKSEQVLFCRLTPVQRKEYRRFLMGEEVQSILQGRRQALYGIDIMRKICNHPDLLARVEMEKDPDYGNPARSGKMKVVQALLAMWKRQGHRCLLFCQTRQMQDILERLLKTEKHAYRRMDGTTPIKSRIAMVDEFNARTDVFCFLLTTKVGGLGINLTGANRIVIFDPDWNPSTDVQARERAWRIGQTRTVTIYRLMTSGTIEEKIYHRQIYKQFLGDKVLKDPRQKRFFGKGGMAELFVLGGEGDVGTETGDLFSGMRAEVNFDESGNRIVGEDEEDCEEEGAEQAAEVEDGQVQEDAVPGELSCIAGLAKAEVYRPPEGEDEEQPDGGGDASASSSGNKAASSSAQPPPKDDDSRFLATLFASTGVHSALHHDVIVDAASPEHMIVEREATRVANEAVAALRKSRKAIGKAREGVWVPTFTGRSGGAVSAPKFGPRSSGSGGSGSTTPVGAGSAGAGFGSAKAGVTTSASLLAGLRARAAITAPTTSAAASTSPAAVASSSAAADGGPPPHPLVTAIVSYLSSRPRARATATDILARFRSDVKDGDVPVFKKMLKGVAEYRKERIDGDEVGWWYLRAEFR